jgi:hypothetical protein
MNNVMTVMDYLFGCHHKNLSRVFTINKHSYKVCCDCGKAFDYSLETMSIQRLPHDPLNRYGYYEPPQERPTGLRGLLFPRKAQVAFEAKPHTRIA